MSSEVADMDKVSKILVKASPGCIRVLQLIGYWQASFIDGQLLPWSKQRRFITSAILTTLYLVYFYLSHRVGSKWCSDSLALTVTEKFSHNSMLIGYTILKLYYSITGSINAPATARFWHRHVEKLEEFCGLREQFDIRVETNESHGAALQEIRKGVCKLNIVGVLVTVITATIMTGRCSYNMITSHSFQALGFLDIFMPLLCFFWCLQMHCHFASAVHKSFFLRLYAMCIRMIKQEFQELGKLRRNAIALSASDTEEEIMMGRLGKERRVRVQVCVRAYGIITDLVEDFSRHFGPEILAELGLTVVVILLSVFFAVAWGYTRMYVTGAIILLPVSLFVLQLYCLSTEATNLQDEANRVLQSLPEVPAEDLPYSVQAQIQLLATAISVNPLRVQACYFTRIERHLLTSIASAVVTYLVVLVQFRKSDQ